MICFLITQLVDTRRKSLPLFYLNIRDVFNIINNIKWCKSDLQKKLNTLRCSLESHVRLTSLTNKGMYLIHDLLYIIIILIYYSNTKGPIFSTVSFMQGH